MQKCSLCGGRVVNGRCEECGMPIPPEHTYTLRGESAHYHRVNGEDVLHRVRPTGSRPKVEGYDDEERTAHVHESGTDRHNAPRPAVRTARVEHHIEAPSRRRRSANAAWIIIVVALFLILPMLQVLLQREIGSSVSEPVPEFSEEQAIEADSNAYDDLRGTVPAAGADWDGDLTAGLYTVGQDLPEGTYTIQCAESNTSIDLHIVSDEYGVEIYEDLSSNGYDAIDSERDDVSLPTGTVLFLSGNGTLYFHSSNAQVDALPTETAPNPLVSDAAYTLSDSDDSLYLLVGEDIEPGVYDVTCTAGTGYFSFVLPMENTRTMYCSAWLYGDPDYVDTLRHITLTEDTEVTLSNYSDMDFTVTLTPSETVYVHE
ncbi:zinc ribbon domain-containing protein [uncultured Gemmiger sp.]|uniref:zinc ribbon domain-containing protein n=1 Tax=Gemmiger sp. TaxID=2049027 RepID=UPI0025E3AFD1|nr:zinc ribbon domain-containing protein [uncultured Gemmiger sp.]